MNTCKPGWQPLLSKQLQIFNKITISLGNICGIILDEWGNKENNTKQESLSNDTESVCEICRRLNNVKQSIPMVTRSISFSNTRATETIIGSDLISRNSVPECLGVCV